MLPEVGALVGGQYKVERRIGEGGMAVVYEVSTPEGQRLAMKVLKPDYAKSPEVVSRFNREGRAIRKLKSPHAVQVVDVAVASDGLPFMTMELLAGRDLCEELEKRGPLPIHEAVGYIIQACVAMREAHHRRIVHRDLKPDNLFLVRVGDDTIIKVLDFGVSKIQDELTEMTGTEAVMGTPYYMSPEQVRSSKTADARSDLWSLGVILYELLTGRVPYDGEGNLAYVMVSICVHPLPPMREARPEIPPALEAAILRALEKDREKRVQTAEDWIRDLANATGLPMPPLESLEPLGSMPDISAVYPLPAPAPPPTPPPRKTSLPPWPILVGAAIAPLLLGIVLVVALYHPADTKPASSARSSATVAPVPSETVALPVVSATAIPSASAPPKASASASASVVRPRATGVPNVLSHRR